MMTSSAATGRDMNEMNSSVAPGACSSKYGSSSPGCAGTRTTWIGSSTITPATSADHSMPGRPVSILRNTASTSTPSDSSSIGPSSPKRAMPDANHTGSPDAGNSPGVMRATSRSPRNMTSSRSFVTITLIAGDGASKSPCPPIPYVACMAADLSDAASRTQRKTRSYLVLGAGGVGAAAGAGALAFSIALIDVFSTTALCG